MDEMKIKLSTKFMRGVVAKILSKTIFSKFGYNVDIKLNGIEIKTIDGKIHFHINADAEISNDEFMKVLKTINLD